VSKFWIVWNQCSLTPNPRVRHQNIEAANAEAERLARAHKGFTFHVMEWRGACQSSDVTWQRDDKTSV
jgi:hypothetical protein